MNTRKIFKNTVRTGVATLAAAALVLNVAGYFAPVAQATTNTLHGLKLEKIVSNTKAPEWKEEVYADPGDIVQFKLTIWNMSNQTMTNVIVRDTLPTGLTYFSGHFHIISNAGQVNNPSNLGDFFASGINISHYSELGLSGGLPPYNSAHNWEYVEILFKASVECPTVDDASLKNRGYAKSDQTCGEEVSATAKVKGIRLCQVGLDLEKIVSNTEVPAWKETVKAEYADRVEFKLTFKNTGELTLHNVTVRDVLPDKLTYYADGKIRIVSNAGTVESTDAAAFFGSGLNLGDLPPYDAAHDFEYVEVTFIATVNTCPTDAKITVTNHGYVRADDVSEITDPAYVEIAKCSKPRPEEEGEVLGAAKVLPTTGPEDLISTSLFLGYLGFLLRRLKLTRYF